MKIKISPTCQNTTLYQWIIRFEISTSYHKTSRPGPLPENRPISISNLQFVIVNSKVELFLCYKIIRPLTGHSLTAFRMILSLVYDIRKTPKGGGH